MQPVLWLPVVLNLHFFLSSTTFPYAFAICKLFSYMYWSTSFSFQNDIGLLCGCFISQALQPYLNHFVFLCLLSSAIIAVIGTFPFSFSYWCTVLFSLCRNTYLIHEKGRLANIYSGRNYTRSFLHYLLIQFP